MNWLSVPYQKPGGLSPADAVLAQAARSGLPARITADAIAATTISSDALRPTTTGYAQVSTQRPGRWTEPMTADDTMRAMIFEAVGQPLREVALPIPKAGPGQ